MRMSIRILSGIAGLALIASGSAGADQSIADKYPESVLYSRPVEIVPGVWSSIGATAPPTYENSGHNNNLSFVVTNDGMLVVNGGKQDRKRVAVLEAHATAVADLEDALDLFAERVLVPVFRLGRVVAQPVCRQIRDLLFLLIAHSK